MKVGKQDMRGKFPESWACIDCGINTAPGVPNRQQGEAAFAADWKGEGVQMTFNERSEIYTVKPAVWAAAKMADYGGCLCIGCLENRIGRMLKPSDFVKNHSFNSMPGTDRLLGRQGGDFILRRDGDLILFSKGMKIAKRTGNGAWVSLEPGFEVQQGS